MKLTAKRVARLLKKKPGRHHDGHGLILQVTSPSNASWLLRYQRHGREHWLGLGPVHTVSLADARVRAKAARLQLLDGVDPVQAKRDRALHVVVELEAVDVTKQRARILWAAAKKAKDRSGSTDERHFIGRPCDADRRNRSRHG